MCVRVCCVCVVRTVVGDDEDAVGGARHESGHVARRAGSDVPAVLHGGHRRPALVLQTLETATAKKDGQCQINCQHIIKVHKRISSSHKVNS